MIVRPIELRDIEQVAALCEQWGYPASLEQFEDRVRGILDAQGNQIFVAELEETVCGWVHVQGVHTLGSDPYAEIRGLVVDENTRQQGVGRQLMFRAEMWALDNGYTIVRLRSGTHRPEAYHFYPKLGYERTKSQYVYQKFLHHIAR